MDLVLDLGVDGFKTDGTDPYVLGTQRGLTHCDFMITLFAVNSWRQHDSLLLE